RRGRAEPARCAPKMLEHLGVGEMRVLAARVRDHEDARRADSLGLLPARDADARRLLRERPPRRDPDEDDRARAPAGDLASEDDPACRHVLGTEVGHARSRPGDEVRDADAYGEEVALVA